MLRYPVPATELRAAVTQALGSIHRNTPEGAGAFIAPPHSHPHAISPNGYPPNAAAAAHSAAYGSPVNGQGTTMGHGNGNAGHANASSVSFPTQGHASNPINTPSGNRAEQLVREMGVVGTDSCLRLAIEMAATIAPTRTPVLVVGERGTGKSLIARAIHGLGSRHDQPFVTVDCAALTEATAEREQATAQGVVAQGHDARFDWTTKLAQAQGGTLFLNDVSALSDALQVQLLRVLQDREYGQGGAPTDVRVLMSASEHLVSLVDQSKFRQDLYHRASVVCLKLPPLRHRGGDVEQIAEYFRSRFSLEYGKNVVGFTRDALDILMKHDWPGNVRELEGVIQRGVALCQATRITSGHISPSLCHPRASRMGQIVARSNVSVNIRPLKEALEEPEKRIIIQALQALNWNRQETARVLDINRTTLYKKMKKYGLLVDEPIWVN